MINLHFTTAVTLILGQLYIFCMAGEICSLLKEQYIWPGLSCESKCSVSERLTPLPSCRLSCNELREIIPPADKLSPIFLCFHTRLYLPFFHFPVPAGRCGNPSSTFFFFFFFSIYRELSGGLPNNPCLLVVFLLRAPSDLYLLLREQRLSHTAFQGEHCSSHSNTLSH